MIQARDDCGLDQGDDKGVMMEVIVLVRNSWILYEYIFFWYNLHTLFYKIIVKCTDNSYTDNWMNFVK